MKRPNSPLRPPPGSATRHRLLRGVCTAAALLSLGGLCVTAQGTAAVAADLTSPTGSAPAASAPASSTPATTPAPISTSTTTSPATSAPSSKPAQAATPKTAKPAQPAKPTKPVKPAKKPGKGVATISAGDWQVQVSTAFPQVISYTDTSTGARMDGNATILSAVTINGTSHTVTVSAHAAAKKVDYTLTMADLPGISIGLSITVAKDGTVDYAVTKVTDPSATIQTLAIPGLNLISASSAQSGAQVATAIASVDRAKSGDTITNLTASTPTDAKPVPVLYGIVSNSTLAAAVETNSYGLSSDNERLDKQVVADGDGDGVRAGVGPGPWVIHYPGAPQPDPLPWAKVALGGDVNGTKTVDWQDGAVAMRKVAVAPQGSAAVPDRVIVHIPFNIASQATHPFLQTEDDVKRISLATDGLGQMTLLKGYQGEGHDTDHPDYAGHYNQRAGGLTAMNDLISDGKDWGSQFAVHISPVSMQIGAKNFDPSLANMNALDYAWLQDSYTLNLPKDLAQGSFAKRIQQLADETNNNLTTLYNDAYYGAGWQSAELARVENKAGFTVATEWAYPLEPYSTWSHWASDEHYGGADDKGLNSKIMRIVHGTQKDVWNPDPMLGNDQLAEFEGWTGYANWNAFKQNVWTQSLPAKYLQHFQINNWQDHQIDLSDGVSVSDATGTRIVTVNGTTVLDGSSYLLPWSDTNQVGTQTRLYHYNANGGQTTWTLTGKFAHAKSLTMYELTDNGRANPVQVPVIDGKVTLNAKANTAYVLYKNSAPALPNPQWGQHTSLTDPGFNAANLNAWNPTGGATQTAWGNGYRVASLGTQGPSSISQQVKPLKKGTYAATAFVQVGPNPSRATTLKVSGPGVKAASTTIERSTALNEIAADEKHTGDTTSYFQRVRVLFDVSADGATPTLSISALAGNAPVLIDDVEVQATTRPAGSQDPGVVVSQDFEGMLPGWDPFVSATSSPTDPNTYLVERNGTYTQKGGTPDIPIDLVLSGQYSLDSHNASQGMVYRTWSGSAPLKSGHSYQVSFDYTTTASGQYQWATGYDAVDSAGKVSSVITHRTDMPEQDHAKHFTENMTAGCGDSWVGLYRNGGGSQMDFVLDNFSIKDLGTAKTPTACGSLTVDPGTKPLKQGQNNTVTTTLALHETAPVQNASVKLAVPEGWTATATSATTAANLPADGTLTTTWNVVPAADADGSYPLKATADYTATADPQGPRTLDATQQVPTYPKAPTGTVYASDLTWVSMDNGWGPVEKDMSLGEQAAGDGRQISINGHTYDKGLGVASPSHVTYYLGGKCSTFSADVGIDDEVGGSPDMQFEVLGSDGTTQLATSSVLLGGQDPEHLTADVSGQDFVTLQGDPGPKGAGSDHGDWADAQFVCGG